jgi:hypothetical protein
LPEESAFFRRTSEKQIPRFARNDNSALRSFGSSGDEDAFGNHHVDAFVAVDERSDVAERLLDLFRWQPASSSRFGLFVMSV